MMKKSRLEQMQAQICCHLDAEQSKRITQSMEKEYQSLCASDINIPEALIRHTRRNIFPLVAAFRALLADGMERTQAAALAQDTFLELMEAPAAAIRRILKFPGLYRLMPRIWKTLMPKMFGEDAGFQFRFYPTDSLQVKFDMLECPYHRICRELGCPELAPAFCTTDDICYGHMHPKLIWNRTKTLARGGDLCDFDLYIPK